MVTLYDDTRLQNLPADGELPNLRTVEFSEMAEHTHYWEQPCENYVKCM